MLKKLASVCLLLLSVNFLYSQQWIVVDGADQFVGGEFKLDLDKEILIFNKWPCNSVYQIKITEQHGNYLELVAANQQKIYIHKEYSWWTLIINNQKLTLWEYSK